MERTVLKGGLLATDSVEGTQPLGVRSALSGLFLVLFV
jgi:hypothetical protein